MNKLFKLILPLILFSLFMPFVPAQAAGNAIFRLTSTKTDYYVGENVYVDVMVEPTGESINTVRLISNFTGGDVLLANDFSLGTAWPNQSPGRELNNTTQHINVGGFILVDSVSTNSKFGTLILKANKVGTSTINFATGSHLISPDQIERLNIAASQNITINVLGAPPQPNRAPVFDAVGNKSIELGQSVSFHVHATDSDGDNVTLSTDIPADAAFNNVTTGLIAEGDFSWAPTARGIYTLIFYGTDDNSTGSRTGSLTVQVNVSTPVLPANQAPIFQPVSNKSIRLGESVNFHVQATDPNGDKVNLSWNIPTGASFGNVVNNAIVVSGDFSWTPTAEGVFTAIFTGLDNHATDPKSATLAVSIGVSVPPNHAPVFEPLTEKSVNAGETLTFNVSATDPDGDNVSLSLEPMDTAALNPITSGITSTSRFSWSPTHFGIYYVVFKAKDDNAISQEGTQTVRVTVFGGECPPCSGSGEGGGGGTCPIPQCEKKDFGQPLIRESAAIISPSHPNPQLWYSDNKPQFVWEASDPGLGYVFNLDQHPFADPIFGYFFGQDSTFSSTALADGFWYFHLKVKYLDGYGPTSHFLVKIDTTSPEFFMPSIEGDQLFFSAIDKYSGVAYFEMKLDDGKWQKIMSPYVITSDDRKAKVMLIRAVDNAGNAIETRIDMPKLEVIKEDIKKYVIDKPEYAVEAPIIDKIDFPVIRGRALPAAKVYLFISTEPQTIIYTLTDYQGKWTAYVDKKLIPGKYSIYGIANYNFVDSAPSETVYFTVTAASETLPSKFQTSLLWVALLAAALIAALVLIYLIFKLKKYLFGRKIFKKGYKLGGHDQKIRDRIQILIDKIRHAKTKK